MIVVNGTVADTTTRRSAWPGDRTRDGGRVSNRSGVRQTSIPRSSIHNADHPVLKVAVADLPSKPGQQSWQAARLLTEVGDVGLLGHQSGPESRSRRP